VLQGKGTEICPALPLLSFSRKTAFFRIMQHFPCAYASVTAFNVLCDDTRKPRFILLIADA